MPRPVQPDPTLSWPIEYEGVQLIAQSEGCRLKAYPDPATGGVPWTCGWGETKGVTPFTEWSQAEADQRLCARLAEFSASVRRFCKREPSAHELAAMTSLAYNIGLGAFGQSSVLRLHNAGDKPGAAESFMLWVKAAGKVMPGLVTRRANEAKLYRKA